MNRAQIERAERIAERIRKHDESIAKLRGIERVIKAADEGKKWQRPNSLAQPKNEYDFTEEQLLIAARSIAKGNK